MVVFIPYAGYDTQPFQPLPFIKLSNMKSMQCFMVALIMVALISCNNEPAADTTSAAPAFSLDSAKAAIAASNDAFMAAFTKGDSTGVAACYATDGKIMPAGMPAIEGQAGISGFVAASVHMGLKDFKLSTSNVWGGEELVGEEGTYTLTAADGTAVDNGKYIVLWKKENGAWKMFRDVWTSNVAPAPAK